MKKDVEADIAAVKRQQSELLDLIAERSKAGRPLSILADKLDALEATLTEMQAELAVVAIEKAMKTKLPPLDKSAIAALTSAIFEEVDEARRDDMASFSH